MSPIGSTTPNVSHLKRWLARSRAWISLAVLIPIGAAAIFSKPVTGIDTWADFVMEMLGGLLFVGGVCMRWWSTLYIGGRKTDELVCDGPYSICRNPIYVGTFLLTLAAAVLLESLTLTIAVFVVSAWYFFTTVTVEEAILRKRHGEQFAKYCERVPRVVPKLTLYRSAPYIELRMDGVRAEFLRTLRYIWLPIACHLVTHLRSQEWWPDLNNLP